MTIVSNERLLLKALGLQDGLARSPKEVFEVVAEFALPEKFHPRWRFAPHTPSVLRPPSGLCVCEYGCRPGRGATRSFTVMSEALDYFDAVITDNPSELDSFCDNDAIYLMQRMLLMGVPVVTDSVA